MCVGVIVIIASQNMKIKRYEIVLKWIGFSIAFIGIIFAIFYDIFTTHVCVLLFNIIV